MQKGTRVSHLQYGRGTVRLSYTDNSVALVDFGLTYGELWVQTKELYPTGEQAVETPLVRAYYDAPKLARSTK